MGNHQSSSLNSREVSRIPARYRDRFSASEMALLHQIFQDLARRSPNKTVDPEHFGEYVCGFPGLHGEQVFTAFDTKQTGNLDFEEFVSGLARSARGTREEKVKFLFQIYDLKRDGYVSKSELQKMINMVPRDRLHKPQQRVSASFGVRDHRFGGGVRVEEEEGEARIAAASEGPASSEGPAIGVATHRLFQNTNDDLVEEAFEKCDLNRDGRLSYEQFSTWIETTAPQALEFVEEVLESAIRAAARPRKPALGNRRQTSEESSDLDMLPMKRSKSPNLLLPEEPEQEPRRRGHLSKLGYKTSHLTTRYFVLVGNCLYYFAHKGDSKPRGLIFLGGCQVEKLPESIAPHGKFGFRIVHLDSERLGQRQHSLYSSSESDRDAWMDVICDTLENSQKQGTFDIGRHYDLGEELGSGRFAIARVATDKATKSRVAIKSIEKRQQREGEDLAKHEREMFRREIAVMRLARHGNVLPLLAVFEDRKHLHLVMPLMKTDLAKYMTERLHADNPTTEAEAKICFPVILGAVAYLHHLGVAHRDLKPDNILMEDEDDLTKLRLADFSISQILKPDEVITKAAGSIEYMAPEVYLKKGSSFPADVWALGVIGFLIVFNRQPFGGDTKSETIGNILDRKIQLDEPDWILASPPLRDLIDAKMLQADPKERITAREALETHPWMAAHAALLSPKQLSPEDSPL
ncbi:hypothetical protein CTAYLR_006520 [Chrysophaeum taylorii]|uniref:Calmodulin n=1 Tax=Chrysophaeum taylorii TaxID=2483200 RepID=A0AAD7UFH7_9STRA|nr:hypothetical protein CTAYLR_006520 [Chrysophaeum taylorii]